MPGEAMGLVAYVLEQFSCWSICGQFERGVVSVEEDRFFLFCNGCKMRQWGLHPAKRIFCSMEMAEPSVDENQIGP